MTTITEALELMQSAGTKVLDIYFAEMLADGDTEYSVDVICDPVNDLTMQSWTWTISSFKTIEEMMKDDEYFICADWEIITDKPFTNDVVSGAIDEWLLSSGFDMTTRVIDIDDAAGSGYVRKLRDMDLEYEIENATPFGALFLEED